MLIEHLFWDQTLTVNVNSYEQEVSGKVRYMHVDLKPFLQLIFYGEC